VCITVENMTAEIYTEFGDRFPDAMSFFRELSKEEENHAAILAIGKEFDRRGKLPEDAVPESMPHIDGSLNFIKGVKERIKGREITLKDALEMSLSMEETTVESYVQEILIKETDSRVIKSLQRLLLEERLHIEKITEFMKEQGF